MKLAWSNEKMLIETQILVPALPLTSMEYCLFYFLMWKQRELLLYIWP